MKASHLDTTGSLEDNHFLSGEPVHILLNARSAMVTFATNHLVELLACQNISTSLCCIYLGPPEGTMQSGDTAGCFACTILCRSANHHLAHSKQRSSQCILLLPAPLDSDQVASFAAGILQAEAGPETNGHVWVQPSVCLHMALCSSVYLQQQQAWHGFLKGPSGGRQRQVLFAGLLSRSN